jgi:hypothetical protein
MPAITGSNIPITLEVDALSLRIPPTTNKYGTIVPKMIM